MRYNTVLKFISLILGGAILLSSCKKEEFIYQKEIKSNRLTNILKAQGLEFDGDNLLVNDKARAVKSLDLSSLGLTSLDFLERLEVLPNLEELILKHNNFGSKIDLSKLPKQVKSLDLSDNQIYEFNGLADVDIAEAKVKTLRRFRKLVLPYSARLNVEVLPFYAHTNKDIQLLMQNKFGKVEPYTTLRKIPDPNLRKFFKRIFKSKFQGDEVNLIKNFSLKEKNAKMNISNCGGFWGDEELEGVIYTSLEGVEYFLNDPRYSGDLMYLPKEGDKTTYTLEYLKPGVKCTGFMVENISTKILDLSSAKNLCRLSLDNDVLVKEIDLSNTKKFMRRGVSGFKSWGEGDMLIFVGCPNLQYLKMPNLTNSDNLVTINTLALINLPKLKSIIDLRALQVIDNMMFAEISAVPEIKYPKKIAYFTDQGEFVSEQKEGEVATKFYIDKDVYKRSSTQSFIERYKPFLNATGKVQNSEQEYFDDDKQFPYYYYKPKAESPYK